MNARTWGSVPTGENTLTIEDRLNTVELDHGKLDELVTEISQNIFGRLEILEATGAEMLIVSDEEAKASLRRYYGNPTLSVSSGEIERMRAALEQFLKDRP